MRALGTGMSALVVSLAFAAAALAEPAGWQPSLEVARQQAAQTNRLVMIFFHNDACVYCKLMQRDVFSQKAVMDSLQANYTLVQVNADKLPAVATQYGIVKLPTTVLTTPDGQMLDKIEGRKDAQQLVAQMTQTASTARRPAMVAQTPVARPAAAPTGVPSPYAPPAPPVAAIGPQGYAPSAYQPPPPPVPSPAIAPGAYAPPAAPAMASMTPPATPTPAVAPMAPPIPSTPPGPPVVSNTALSNAPAAVAPASVAPPVLPPGNPPLGLDGFCPVQLTETQRWVPGDRRFGLVHRGRTYLFASQVERDRFNLDPDKYAPVMSGNDIVLAVEQGQNVNGRREHGVFFGQRIYLFSAEASLDRFSKNPAYYVDQALQAMRAGAAPTMYR